MVDIRQIKNNYQPISWPQEATFQLILFAVKLDIEHLKSTLSYADMYRLYCRQGQTQPHHPNQQQLATWTVTLLFTQWVRHFFQTAWLQNLKRGNWHRINNKWHQSHPDYIQPDRDWIYTISYSEVSYLSIVVGRSYISNFPKTSPIGCDALIGYSLDYNCQM